MSDTAVATAAAAAEAEATIIVNVELPISTAVALKHRTGGKLDVAETLALIAALYHDAPLERDPVVLTHDQHGRICEALGQSPQSLDDLVSAIETLTSFSFGGVRLKLTGEDINLLNSRNASELSPREYAELVLKQMFEAWRDGRI